MLIFSFAIVLFGLAIDVLAFVIHWKTGLKLREGLTMTGFCLSFWLMGLVFKFQLRGRTSREPVESGLDARFKNLCRRLKLADLSLVVGDKSKISGGSLRNEVFLSSGAISGLGSAGVDFIIGHELAHKRFFASKMSLRPKWFIALYFGNLVIVMVFLRLEIPLQMYLVLLAPSIVFVPYFVIMYPNAATAAGPEMELACDYVALSVIDDKHGAIEAMEGLSHGSKLDRKIFGYPSKEGRIQQIESFISGIPRVPSKNKFVEERIGAILQDVSESLEFEGMSHSNQDVVPPLL